MTYKNVTNYKATIKYGAGAVLVALILSMTPIAFADTIEVISDGTANVSGTVVVTASTGGNTSRGDTGGAGGDGGSTGAGHDESSSGGDGGDGGAGGDGGVITTGDAIGTAIVSTEVNTTDVEIEDSSSDEGHYNESITERVRSGSELQMTYHAEESYSEESSDSFHEEHVDATETSTDGDDDTSWSNDEETSEQTSNSYNELNTYSEEHGSLATATHDDYDFTYTRTYVDSNDSITVANSADANVGSTVVVDAASGGNLSRGEYAGRGGDGGGTGSGNDDDTTGGNGGNGGAGGSGAAVTTGTADSLADVVTIVGRSITRIVRN